MLHAISQLALQTDRDRKIMSNSCIRVLRLTFLSQIGQYKCVQTYTHFLKDFANILGYVGVLSTPEADFFFSNRDRKTA